MIKDDGSQEARIAKNTQKENVGGFLGAVGGWPGGEAGLKAFIEVSDCDAGHASARARHCAFIGTPL